MLLLLGSNSIILVQFAPFFLFYHLSNTHTKTNFSFSCRIFEIRTTKYNLILDHTKIYSKLNLKSKQNNENSTLNAHIKCKSIQTHFRRNELWRTIVHRLHHRYRHQPPSPPPRPTTTVLERPSSQMSYLDHFLKESGSTTNTTHTTSSTIAINMVRCGKRLPFLSLLLFYSRFCFFRGKLLGRQANFILSNFSIDFYFFFVRISQNHRINHRLVHHRITFNHNIFNSNRRHIQINRYV